MFQVPRWVRGVETAQLTQPRQADIYIMGLMDSQGGAAEGPVVVVTSFDDLVAKAVQVRRPLSRCVDIYILCQNLYHCFQVPGSIVVFDQGWDEYGHGYNYRYYGASNASSYGAIGCLIRSVTDYSIYAPHTGSQARY